jgi:hypothetical protein
MVENQHCLQFIKCDITRQRLNFGRRELSRLLKVIAEMESFKVSTSVKKVANVLSQCCTTPQNIQHQNIQEIFLSFMNSFPSVAVHFAL